MKKFFLSIFVVSAAALLLSGVVDYKYCQVYEVSRQWPPRIFPHPPISEPYEIVKVGNSHAEDGLTFADYRLKSLSLSAVAQSFEYDLAMLKMYKNQIKDNALIIINVSPLSFSQGRPTRFNGINTNYYDGRLSPWLIPHFNIGIYIERQLLPFVQSGVLWRQRHAEFTKQQAMNTYGQRLSDSQNTPIANQDNPKLSLRVDDAKFSQEDTGMASVSPSSHLSRVDAIRFELHVFQSDQKRLEDSALKIYEKWLVSKDFLPDYFSENRKDLENLVQYCLSQKWRPVLITLPISQILIDNLGAEYLPTYVNDHVQQLQARDILYIDFNKDTRLTQNARLFSNADHLNSKGADIVSFLLLEKLIEHQILPAAANGYRVD